MLSFVARRVLEMIPTVILLVLVVFILMQLVPGDPAMMVGDPRAARDPEVMERLREHWGLDKSLPVQFFTFLGKLVRGKLGRSYAMREPVVSIIAERIPVTLRLAFSAILFSAVFGMALGILSALNKGTMIDLFAMSGAVFGISMPNFWLGLMLIFLFGVILGILPTNGYGGGDIRHLILPMVTVGTAYMATITRTSRAAILDMLNKDYVRTARSKGLTERLVISKHVIRNALIPIITILGLQFGFLLTNTFVAEIIFSYPGLGSLMINSISRRDLPTLQGCILVAGLTFLILNLLIDVLYAYLDPRIRYD
ncbi:ABC transporter permease [Candidatus Bipolaricaulota bacterium]|nr:ABC transporter permease [Candidatus Bipolaricaulota bacterium]